MPEIPRLTDYAIYKGEVSEELELLDELARFKRALGLKALRAGDLKVGMVSFLQGIGFYRCWELPLVVSYFQPSPGTKILDVGSLKSILPLYLALRGCDVSVLDIDPQVMLQQKYARYVGRRDLIDNGLAAIVQDATRMDYADASFDLITNISAVEHFTDDGDISFVKEAARLLKGVDGLAVGGDAPAAIGRRPAPDARQLPLPENPAVVGIDGVQVVDAGDEHPSVDRHGRGRSVVAADDVGRSHASEPERLQRQTHELVPRRARFAGVGEFTHRDAR